MMEQEVREDIKSEIVGTFRKNVSGKKFQSDGFNPLHDGREGDWLTKLMGLTVNGKNEPDFKGFEMKKMSIGKTSFGDWSPNKALYIGRPPRINRDEFLHIFGAPNLNKDGRYSWSGKVFPKVGHYNFAGQIMNVESSGNIVIEYSASKDSRPNKRKIVPSSLLEESIILALWEAAKLKTRLERKFDQLGWFRLLHNSHGVYEEIQFGYPINYENFLKLVKTGDIFLDCGMHQGNPRPYMTWRAANGVWDRLSEEIRS